MFSNIYSDCCNKLVELTTDELTYFRSVADKFLPIMEKHLGVIVPIYNRNHDEMSGKHREALGIFSTDNRENVREADAFITIDNYFIHECYDSVFNGGFNLAFQSLEEVIAHEIAHGLQFRHCKRHTKLTQLILTDYYA